MFVSLKDTKTPTVWNRLTAADALDSEELNDCGGVSIQGIDGLA